MDRLEIAYHLDAREGEESIDAAVQQLKKLLASTSEEPVFVSKNRRGPQVEATIVCHVKDADATWRSIKPEITTYKVPGKVVVRTIDSKTQASVVLYPDEE